MVFRQLLNDETACASYLTGCTTGAGVELDPHPLSDGDLVKLGNTEDGAHR
jgi:hypothetical protein